MDVIDDIKARLDDLEAELDEEIERGKGKIVELTDDLRMRIERIRDGEEEPSPTTVETLEGKLDELRSEIEDEIDEGTEKLSSMLDDVREQIHTLERKIRQD